MKTYLKLAWRNLWRNKSRTLITSAAVFFGVLLSAFMSSMQEGSYDHYIDTIVNYFSGYIQIHKAGYWDEKTINNTFIENPDLINAVNRAEGVTLTTPRLESFALASHAEITKGALIIGIDPEREDRVTGFSGKTIRGGFLAPSDPGVLVAEELARYMKLDVNDSIVLLGQGYHGATAAGLFRIAGILKHPSPDLNRELIYMDINTCRKFFSAGQLCTSLVVMLNDNDNLKTADRNLQSLTGDDYEVMTWEEMQPILVQQIESDRASGKVMKAILYILIGFGILGTIMMMMAERKKEFGVIIAVGMRKYKLSVILLLETFLVGLTGVAAGLAASLPLNYYFYLNPIPLTGKAAEMVLNMGFDPVMKFSMDTGVFLNQAITIFAITVMIAVYPLVTVGKLKIMNALRA
ncbi:MAG: ABC transporter permease [Bacteroidales bacterium]|nr:ABC transporter permease [Bacteroidales bacterium]